jgi:DNA-binding SARP family transcriptional activator
MLREDLPINARLDAASLLLAHCCNAADYTLGARVMAWSEPWLAEPDVGPVHGPLWWMHAGHYHVARGDDEAAEAAYAQALSGIEANALTVPLLRVHCQVGLAWVALCRGDVEAAEAARARTAAYWTSARRIDSCVDAGLRALIAAWRGDHIEALARAQEQCELADAVGVVPLRQNSRLLLATALVETGQLAEAALVLREARAILREGSHTAAAYKIDLIEAYASLRAGEHDAAHAALARGLAGSRDDDGKFQLRLLPRVLPVLLAEALRVGIDADYAVRLVRAFRLRAPAGDVPGWPWPLEIRALGRFEIRRDGEPLVYSRKTPKKTLALLKAMIALGSGNVSEQRLMDTLWADEEGDAAANSLAATVLRLRALLGDPAAVVQQGGKLSLDRTRVWVDVFAFEQAISAAEAAAHRRDPVEQTHLVRALELYAGAFLAEDEGEGWPVAARERLRGRFIHALGRRAERLEADSEFEAAILVYLRGLDADPAVESFYQGLMRCYQRLGRRSEAIGAYQRLKQILSITLGLAPSAASERLYQALRAE